MIPEPNRIICDDALACLRLLPDGWAQTVIADPPYYNVLTNESWDTQWADEVAYIAWCEDWVKEAMRVVRSDGLLFCFGQLGKREKVFLQVMASLTRHYQFHDLLIWDRVVGYNERRDSFTPAYEMILILRKSQRPYFNKDVVRETYPPEVIAKYARDKRYKNKEARLAHLHRGKYATNILRVPSLKGSSSEKRGHPSQKPAALIRKLILCASRPGDLVLDPFIGSGTTAICAKQLGRSWFGVDKNPAYATKARKAVEATRAPAPISPHMERLVGT